METIDTIRSILEEGGRLLVSFHTHDGYFNVPLTDEALCAAVREAAAGGKAISVIFDRDLRISKIGKA